MNPLDQEIAVADAWYIVTTAAVTISRESHAGAAAALWFLSATEEIEE